MPKPFEVGRRLALTALLLGCTQHKHSWQMPDGMVCKSYNFNIPAVFSICVNGKTYINPKEFKELPQ